jgi:hypothetical protein
LLPDGEKPPESTLISGLKYTFIRYLFVSTWPLKTLLTDKKKRPATLPVYKSRAISSYAMIETRPYLLVQERGLNRYPR